MGEDTRRRENASSFPSSNLPRATISYARIYTGFVSSCFICSFSAWLSIRVWSSSGLIIVLCGWAVAFLTRISSGFSPHALTTSFSASILLTWVFGLIENPEQAYMFLR